MLYALIGPSGSGKTSLGESYFGKENELVSFTTREKRAHEINGRDYWFISKEKFHDMKTAGELAEFTEYAGNFYGLSISEIARHKGECYAVVNYEGYQQLQRKVKRLVGIFIYIDKNTMLERLRGRGDEEATIEKRIRLYEEEIKARETMLYSVDNSEAMEATLVEIQKIVHRTNVVEIVAPHQPLHTQRLLEKILQNNFDGVS